jgi:hypothetical protein
MAIIAGAAGILFTLAFLWQEIFRKAHVDRGIAAHVVIKSGNVCAD